MNLIDLNFQMNEDSPKEVDLVYDGMTTLLPENISTSFFDHLQRTIEPTLSPLASLNNTSIDDHGETNEEEERRKQEMRFRKAVSFTQEDSPVEDLLERHPHDQTDLVEGYSKDKTDFVEGYNSDRTDLFEGHSDDHTVPDSMLDLINATDEQIDDDFNQFQFTQTQSIDKETPKKLDENSEER